MRYRERAEQGIYRQQKCFSSDQGVTVVVLDTYLFISGESLKYSYDWLFILLFLLGWILSGIQSFCKCHFINEPFRKCNFVNACFVNVGRFVNSACVFTG